MRHIGNSLPVKLGAGLAGLTLLVLGNSACTSGGQQEQDPNRQVAPLTEAQRKNLDIAGRAAASHAIKIVEVQAKSIACNTGTNEPLCYTWVGDDSVGRKYGSEKPNPDGTELNTFETLTVSQRVGADGLTVEIDNDRTSFDATVPEGKAVNSHYFIEDRLSLTNPDVSKPLELTTTSLRKFVNNSGTHVSVVQTGYFGIKVKSTVMADTIAQEYGEVAVRDKPAPEEVPDTVAVQINDVDNQLPAVV